MGIKAYFSPSVPLDGQDCVSVSIKLMLEEHSFCPYTYVIVIPQKILIVEDDNTLRDVLKYNLEKEGYNVMTASDGAQALETARSQKPDLIILDVMLPQLDGFEVCRILRKEMTVPIMMLTAKVNEIDKVVGLELGADDYVTKPFSMRELLARVRAMLRRNEFSTQRIETTKDTAKIESGDLKLDIERHRVTLDNNTVELNLKEFDLLALLMKHRGQVFSRDYLLEKIWGYEYPGSSRTVDVHMRWLRKKIETDPDNPRRLLTVRGVGYKFEG